MNKTTGELDAILAFNAGRIATVADVREFFDALSGLLIWHPDTAFADYVRLGTGGEVKTFTEAEAEGLDATLARCWEVLRPHGVDLYGEALESAERAGWAPKGEARAEAVGTQATLKEAAGLIPGAAFEYPGWLGYRGLAFGDSGPRYGWNDDRGEINGPAGDGPAFGASVAAIVFWVLETAKEHGTEAEPWRTLRDMAGHLIEGRNSDVAPWEERLSYLDGGIADELLNRANFVLGGTLPKWR